MLHTARRTVLVIAAAVLAGCGGGGEGEGGAPPAQTPAAGAAAAGVPDTVPGATAANQAPSPAAPAAPAPSRGGDLTLADAQRAGFVRGASKDFRYIGAVDGAAGTMGGGRVELYAYAGEAPPDRVKEMREMAVPAFGWNGFCQVRNLMMVYEKEEACRALRGLD